MKKVYLDNASTTAIRPEVIAEMTKVLADDYGNPSSSHSYGRSSRNLVELARKSVAKYINASAQEIIFTSCGTEANNIILQSSIRDLKIERIITSKIEHHAVLHTIQVLASQYPIQVDYVAVLPSGEIDMVHLTTLLSKPAKTLVSLMHINNEIGTILNIQRVATICKQYKALFHTDTVQSIGKVSIDLQEIPIDFLVASAHKFHGPKGIGFAYIRKGIILNALLYGGDQEKGLRAGTESIHNIVGMAKALSLSYLHLNHDKQHITHLKKYTQTQLELHFPGVIVNGGLETIYTILNVLLPLPSSKTSMILFHLDMKGIALSRGSACQSGSVKPSHVLSEILTEQAIKKPSLRISFSHYNTIQDIDYLIEALKTV